jgi:hypothetical protein
MLAIRRTVQVPLLLAGALAIALVMACASEPEVITKEVVVEKEVVKTVEVPGETIVVEKEVVRQVEVPGQTVVKEVVKTVEVPGETVVVEKEVVKTVEVEKEVVKTVELIVTPTSVPVAMPGAINAPQPKGEVGIIAIAIEDVAPGVGLGSTQLTDSMHYWGVGVPGETIVVEKEVVRQVEVPGQTVVKEVVKTRSR